MLPLFQKAADEAFAQCKLPSKPLTGCFTGHWDIVTAIWLSFADSSAPASHEHYPINSDCNRVLEWFRRKAGVCMK